MNARLRKPRITCPHCGTVYVMEREGDPLARAEGEEPEPTSPFHPMLPRSHDWYAYFFRLRGKPQEMPWQATVPGGDMRIVHKTALSMLKNARANTGVQCDTADRPTDVERDAMVSIEVGSPEFEAWRKALAAEGYPGFGADGAEWVRVPSVWPPGQEPPEDERPAIEETE